MAVYNFKQSFAHIFDLLTTKKIDLL